MTAHATTCQSCNDKALQGKEIFNVLHAHRHSYNSKSGVAIIIGKATGKILHVGVRNKYCNICSRHPEQPQHQCFLNWEGSSSAMESDIKGFKISKQKHGTSFIGDGDSSVYSSLVEALDAPSQRLNVLATPSSAITLHWNKWYVTIHHIKGKTNSLRT